MNEAAEALHALTRNGEEAVEAKVRKGVLFPPIPNNVSTDPRGSGRPVEPL